MAGPLRPVRTEMNQRRTRLLLVEDDPSIRTWLGDSMLEVGYDVDACATLGAARETLQDGHDLLLLDLGLPDGDGLNLCRELRRAGSKLPIIVLTARDALEERVTGLDSGADDYIVKPIELPELLARVRSVLRRADPPATTERLTIGDVWLESDARVAGKGAEPIELQRREFDLLEFLLRSRGRTWTREQLLAKVWGSGYEGELRSVDMCVRRLRTKIELDARDPKIVETVWGVGYRIREEPNLE